MCLTRYRLPEHLHSHVLPVVVRGLLLTYDMTSGSNPNIKTTSSMDFLLDLIQATSTTFHLC